MKILQVLMGAAFIFIVGCTSIDVRPISHSHNLMHVCIEDNPKVIVRDFVAAIEYHLERYAITSELFQNRAPTHCEFILQYTARQSWDFATYLSYAELRLQKRNVRVGYAQYKHHGGLSMLKWQGSRTKLKPVIEQLLEEYKSLQSGG